MNIGYKLSKAESTLIEDELIKISDECIKDLSTKANMINYLGKRFGGKTRDEVVEIVDKIINGVNNFTEKLEEANINEDAEEWLTNFIEEATFDLPLEKKYDLMLNLLIVLKAFDAEVIKQNLSSDGIDLNLKFEELKSSVISSNESEVSSESLDDMTNMIKEAIKNSTILISGNPEIIDLINDLSTDNNSLEDFVLNNWDDSEFKCYLSLATYTICAEGKIKSMPFDTDPEIIAIGVAAGIERDKIINKLSLGEITWDFAQKALKILGWVAVCCVIAILFATATLLAILAGGTILNFILVGGIIPLAVGLIIGSLFSEKAWITVTDIGGKATDKIIETYKKVSDYIINTLLPKAKDMCIEAWDFIKELIEKGLAFVKKAGKEKDKDKDKDKETEDEFEVEIAFED